jgi:hypothetical protein
MNLSTLIGQVQKAVIIGVNLMLLQKLANMRGTGLILGAIAAVKPIPLAKNFPIPGTYTT